ncbi:MAG: hypothetical protein K2Z80_31650 [Xanthobacteraceae bacterium]|nr:hypothetical protein [Xanthobacteraceae bacterium]
MSDPDAHTPPQSSGRRVSPESSGQLDFFVRFIFFAFVPGASPAAFGISPM